MVETTKKNKNKNKKKKKKRKKGRVNKNQPKMKMKDERRAINIPLIDEQLQRKLNKESRWRAAR